MKNFAILGFASLLLFAVAAGLSVWLQQNKIPAVAEDKEKEGKKEKDKGGLKEPAEKPKPAEAVKIKDEQLLANIELKAQQEAIKSGEARLEKRKGQVELILQDIRAQRDEVDQANKQVAAETRRLLALAAERDAQQKLDDENRKKLPKTDFGSATPLPPKPSDLPDPNERKNIERMAVMFESMAPETAAKIAQQMADSGKMATVVKVLLQMRERAAGRLIEQIPDPALAGQLLDELRKSKRSSSVVPTAAVIPGS